MKFFIAGGTGFIGRHLIDALGDAGQGVKCLARTENKAMLCERIGFNAVIGDITERESLKGKMDECDIAVCLVGIIEEKGGATFERVHVEGARNFVSEAQKAGIKHIFYQSALGASKSSRAKYYKTKAEAEEIVRESGIPYTIFRPSLVVGPGDGFTEKIRGLISLGPFVPVPGGGNAKFQPVYVKDWVKCFMKLFSDISVIERRESQVYEFGGPEHLTYNELVIRLMEAMGIVKPLVHVPLGLMKLGLPFSGIAGRVGALFGKKIPSATKEQILLLQTDNICDKDSIEKLFGFAPMRYGDALKLFIKEG
jgi:NADH dehydrogenase